MGSRGAGRGVQSVNKFCTATFGEVGIVFMNRNLYLCRKNIVIKTPETKIIDMKDVATILKEAKRSMSETIDFLDDKLAKIRAGKANPKLLDDIRVSYYGNPTPLNNVANVSVPDAKTIIITPWEKNLIREIEKAIIDSDLGIMPDNNGDLIRISMPPLTEERRRDLVKQVKGEAEQAKVSVRNARRDGIDTLKKQVKEGMPEDESKSAETDVQKMHDDYIKKIDALFAAKEKEIMTV